MRTLGNILWFIFGGVLGGLAWIFAGCIWCITIIGIPVGLQCFKFASLAFWPFGKEIVYKFVYNYKEKIIEGTCIAKKGVVKLSDAWVKTIGL